MLTPEPLVAVISAGRPGSVPKMHEVLGTAHSLVWFVPEDQVADYRTYGAWEVVGSGGLCRSRNAALDQAESEGRYCLQLSDDLRKLRFYDNAEKLPLSLSGAMNQMAEQMEKHGAKLAGVSPTDNSYFFRKEVHTDAFIVGDMILVDPACWLRFDEELPLKEDYDYTLQHLEKYGVAVRCNRIMPTFQHRTNRGGAVAYRTEELEQQAIARLKDRWPANIKDNARRPNEVLLRWK